MVAWKSAFLLQCRETNKVVNFRRQNDVKIGQITISVVLGMWWGLGIEDLYGSGNSDGFHFFLAVF
jgi:hypothetical protein